MISPFALAALALLSAQAVAAPKASPTAAVLPAGAQWSMPHADICTNSGLRLTTFTDRRTPMVTVVVTLDAGSADDPDGKPGVAHLAEHLWFRASTTQGETVEQLLAETSTYNAITYADQTMFLAQFHKVELDRVLKGQGQFYVNPLQGIDEEIFSAERRIVAQEVRENHVDVAGGGYRWLFNRMFPAPHPYSRLWSATPAAVDALILDDVRAFFAQHLRPDNTTVQIVGDIDSETARAAVWEAFPDAAVGVPTGTLPVSCGDFRPTGIEIPEGPTTREWIEQLAPVEHRQILLGWAIPGGFSPAAAVNRTSVPVLDYYLSNRVEPGTLRRYPSCSAEVMREATAVICSLQLEDSAVPDDVLRLAFGGLQNFTDDHESPRAGWLWRNAVELELRAWLRGAESFHTPMVGGGEPAILFSHIAGIPGAHSPMLSALGASKFDEVMAFGARWFTSERAVRALIVPLRHTQPQTPAVVRSVTPVTPPQAPTPAAIVASAAPPASSDIEVQILDNGLTLALYPFGTAPRVSVELVFRDFSAAGTLPGLAEIVSAEKSYQSTSVPGNPKLMSEPDDPELVSRFPVWRNDASGEQLQGPSFLLEQMLWRLRWELAAAVLEDQNEMDPAEYLGKVLETWWEKPGVQVSELASSYLFVHNPWIGKAGFPEWRRAKNASGRDKKAVLYGARRPERAVLVVVGQFDKVATLESIHKHFGKWPGPDVAFPKPAWTPVTELPAESEIVVVDSPGLSTVRSAAACRLAPAPVVGSLGVLEQLAKDKVFRDLRLRGALAYDPWAEVRSDPVGGNLLLMGASLPLDAAEVGRSGIANALDALAEMDDPNELAWAAKKAAIAELGQRGTLGGMASALSAAMLTPLGARLFQERASSRSATTVLDIRSLLSPCRERVSYVFVGPKWVMAPELARSKLAIREVEWSKYQAERTGLGVR